jgi:ATP synthase protein I
MADTDPPPGNRSDDLGALRSKVEQARAANARKAAPPPSNAASLAMRFGGEFGAAVLVGAGAGYAVDYWLHTNPWGLIIGLTAGFAAGVVNVVRVAQSYAKANPVDQGAPSIPDEAED